LIALLKCGDFTRADILLEDKEFPPQGSKTVLLMFGQDNLRKFGSV
jgi:hypothetical protein